MVRKLSWKFTLSTGMLGTSRILLYISIPIQKLLKYSVNHVCEESRRPKGPDANKTQLAVPTLLCIDLLLAARVYF